MQRLNDNYVQCECKVASQCEPQCTALMVCETSPRREMSEVLTEGGSKIRGETPEREKKACEYDLGSKARSTLSQLRLSCQVEGPKMSW